MEDGYTTGWFSLSDGDQKVVVDEVWPDFKFGYYGQAQSASINLTFNVSDYPPPNNQVYSFGPYPITASTKWINPRMRGRLMSVTVGSNDLGSFWRTGNIRFRIQPDGRY